MTPDIWADYNQIDDDGHVVAYLEDIMRPERVVLDSTVVVADPEAKAHLATVVGRLRGEPSLSTWIGRASRPVPLLAPRRPDRRSTADDHHDHD